MWMDARWIGAPVQGQVEEKYSFSRALVSLRSPNAPVDTGLRRSMGWVCRGTNLLPSLGRQTPRRRELPPHTSGGQGKSAYIHSRKLPKCVGTEKVTDRHSLNLAAFHHHGPFQVQPQPSGQTPSPPVREWIYGTEALLSLATCGGGFPASVKYTHACSTHPPVAYY